MQTDRDKKVDAYLTEFQLREDERQEKIEQRNSDPLVHFTPQSREVLEYFGLDAPYLLNEYCCKVEDALIEVVAKLQDAKQEIVELQLKLECQGK